MVVASGGTTFLDLTDRKKLSVALGCNIPQTQIFNPNNGSYSPDWSSAPNLIITPIVYADNAQVPLNNGALSVLFTKKEGVGPEVALGAGETVAGNVLTVTGNKLADVSSGLLTYIAHVTYLDEDVAEPIEARAQIEFTKVTVGADGATGADAVTFKLYTTTAAMFVNGEGSIEIKTQAFAGATEIVSGATYAWYRYDNGDWGSPIASTSSLTVAGNTVDGIASFKCVMTYNAKQYVDVITLSDKTDNFQCDVVSTGGDVFKNKIGKSCLYANLYQNGALIDALKSPVIAESPPSGPSSGDFYYRINPSTPIVTLMKYNGSTWVEASGSDLHTYTYTWYRRDKDGAPVAEDNGLPFATGKVIYVDGDDVTVKTTFVCEVEDIASGQFTIKDLNDIIISDTFPTPPVDGMMVFRPSYNEMWQYSASTGWQIVTNYTATQGSIGDLEANTVENSNYQQLILDNDNAAALLDLISLRTFLADVVNKSISTDSVGTLLSDALESGFGVRVGTNGIALMQSQNAIATFTMLQTLLPPSLQVGTPTIGSKIRVGNFIAEHQPTGNLTIRKV